MHPQSRPLRGVLWASWFVVIRSPLCPSASCKVSLCCRMPGPAARFICQYCGTYPVSVSTQCFPSGSLLCLNLSFYKRCLHFAAVVCLLMRVRWWLGSGTAVRSDGTSPLVPRLSGLSVSRPRLACRSDPLYQRQKQAAVLTGPLTWRGGEGKQLRS